MKRKLGIVCECIGANTPVENLSLMKDVGFECFFSDSHKLKDVSALKNQAEKLGLDYQFIHSPYAPVNEMWTDGDGYLETINAVKESLDSARECAVSGVILHVSSGWTPPKMSETGFKRFDIIMDYAVKNNVFLAFENLRRPEYLKALLDRYKGVKQAVFCYDCGHEHCFSPNVPIMDIFGERIKYTHFHDNFGMCYDKNCDIHLLPFDGNNDFNKVIDKLDEFNYSGSIMLETFDKPHGHGGYECELKGLAFLEEAYLRATRLNELSKK